VVISSTARDLLERADAVRGAGRGEAAARLYDEAVARRAHLHPVPGGLWLIGPEGAAVPLRALRGFAYLRELLRRPGQPVAALDLAGAGAGAAVKSGLGDLLDTRALKVYRQRLRDLG
jgi:hypothetical protein